MWVEYFLAFWSRYNTLIIEVLIAVILVTVVYLAFRTFFGEEVPQSGDGKNLDLEGLEKTLQKIMSQPGLNAAAGAAAGAATTVVVAGDGANTGELLRLQAELAEKAILIDELRKSMSIGAPAAAGAAAGPTGPSEEERRKQDAYIKNLEARLAEYEIISEDIADLSFYKEENSKLHKELETYKKGGVPIADPAAAAASALAAPVMAQPTPDLIEEVLAAEDESDPILDAATETPPPEPPPALVAEEPVIPEPAAPAPRAPTQQLSPLTSVPPPEVSTEQVLKELADVSATAPAAAPPAVAAEADLIDQFEDFVKKG